MTVVMIFMAITMIGNNDNDNNNKNNDGGIDNE